MTQAENIDYCLTQVVGGKINRVKDDVTYVLEVCNKNPSDKFYLKAGMYMIGRDKTCDIQILDTSLSRQHAIIEVVEQGIVFIQDLGSVNRTFRNRVELRTKVMYELTVGTELNFGVVRAKFMDFLQSPEFEENYSDNSTKLGDGNDDLCRNGSPEQNKLSLEFKTNKLIMTSTPAREMCTSPVEEMREVEKNSDLFDDASTPIETNDSSVIIVANNTINQNNFDDTDILDQSNNDKTELIRETSKLGMVLYEVMGNTEIGEIAPEETEVIEESYPVYEISEDEETKEVSDESVLKKRQITAVILDGLFNSEIVGSNNEDAETVLDHHSDSDGDKDSDLISETDLDEDEEDKGFTAEIKKQSQQKPRRNFDYLGPRLLGRLSQSLGENDQEICPGPANTQEENYESEESLWNREKYKIVEEENVEKENIAYLNSWNEIFTQTSLEKSRKEKTEKEKSENQETQTGKSAESEEIGSKSSEGNSSNETRTSLCEVKEQKSQQKLRKMVSEKKRLVKDLGRKTSLMGIFENSEDERKGVPSEDLKETDSNEKSPISSKTGSRRAINSKSKSKQELIKEDGKENSQTNDPAMELFENSEVNPSTDKEDSKSNNSEKAHTSENGGGKRIGRKSNQDSTKEDSKENTRVIAKSNKENDEELTISKEPEESQTNRKGRKNNTKIQQSKSRSEIADAVLKVNIEKIDLELDPFDNSEEETKSPAEKCLISDREIGKTSRTEEILTDKKVIVKPNKRGARSRSKTKREDKEKTPNDISNEEIEIRNREKETPAETMVLGMEIFKCSEENETKNPKFLGEVNPSHDKDDSEEAHTSERIGQKSNQNSTKEDLKENTRVIVNEELTISKEPEESHTNRKGRKSNTKIQKSKSRSEITDAVLKVNIEKIDLELDPFENSEDETKSPKIQSLILNMEIGKSSRTKEILTNEKVIVKPNKRGTRIRSKTKREEDKEKTPTDKSNEEIEIRNREKENPAETMVLGMEIFKYSEESETEKIKLSNKKGRKTKGVKSKNKATNKATKTEKMNNSEDGIIKGVDLKDPLENLTQVVGDDHVEITPKSDDDLFYEQATQAIDSDSDSVFVSTQVIQDEKRASNGYSSHMFSQIATQVLPETSNTSRHSEEVTFRKPLTTEIPKTPKNRILKNRRTTKSLSNEITIERKISPKPNIFEFKVDDDDDFLQEVDIKVEIPVKVKKEKKKTFGKEITNNLAKTIPVDIDEDQVVNYKNQTKKRSAIKREKLEENGDNKENLKNERVVRKSLENPDETFEDGNKGKKGRKSNKLSCSENEAPKEPELRRSLRIVKDIDSETTTHDIILTGKENSKIFSQNERRLSNTKKRGRLKKNSLGNSDTEVIRTFCKDERSDESQSITKSSKVSRRLSSVKSPSKKKIKADRTEEPKLGSSTFRKRSVKNELNECPCPVKKPTYTQSSSGEMRHAQRLEMQSQLNEDLMECQEPVCRSIMFTGLPDSQFKKAVEKLGANISDDIPRVSHLVTDQVRRTMKFLCCLTMGVPIVTPAWLKASQKSNRFVASAPYIVTKNSNAFKINLQSSIKLAQHYQRLAGGIMAHHRCIVFVTDNTRPDPCQLEQIISCAGGKMLLIQDVSFYEHLNDSESKHICIADSEITKTEIPDLSDRLRALQARNIDILSVEFLLAMIMEQKWPEPENYRINL